MSSSGCRFIFITGGVVSSLGKGITGASAALLLRRRGYRLSIQKLDPYLSASVSAPLFRDFIAAAAERSNE